jgi:hypothetical protein
MLTQWWWLPKGTHGTVVYTVYRSFAINNSSLRCDRMEIWHYAVVAFISQSLLFRCASNLTANWIGLISACMSKLLSHLREYLQTVECHCQQHHSQQCQPPYSVMPIYQVIQKIVKYLYVSFMECVKCIFHCMHQRHGQH